MTLKYAAKCFCAVLLFINVSFSQSQHSIMTYNILNYPGTDTTIRNPHFRTIFSDVQPDILVIQEMTSQSGVDGFLNNILNTVSSGYEAGLFINGPETDNAIFFKNDIFTFISNYPVQTALRDINEFKLVHNLSGDTLIIYSVHLKASNTSDDRLKRAAEIDSLRKRTYSLPAGSDFLVLGDFNIYSSTEPAFQKLLDQSDDGFVKDVQNLVGTWNQGIFSHYHTQSPRVRAFGGGATGGMDDRFDMILISQSVLDSTGITFIPGSYIVYGNDGNHYNDSINKPPNTAVGQLIADALHYAADHLPVIASFSFNPSFVELTSFTALIEGLYNGYTMVPDTVTLELRNASFPYTLIDEQKVLLDNNGQGSIKFYNAVNGVPYFLVIKHRSAIETWSTQAVLFSSGELTYDFTSASNKAFGNNLKLIGNRWCIYNGDVNQDGFINEDDMHLVFTDNSKGAEGYTITDLDRDLFTEINDVNIVFTNKVLEVEIKRPADFPLKSND